MNIFFDFELNDNAEQPVNPNNIVYTELRNFFNQIYKPLEDEIKNSIQGIDIPIIVLSMTEDGLRIDFINIPEGIQKKLKECISQRDNEYINDKIWHMIKDENKKGLRDI